MPASSRQGSGTVRRCVNRLMGLPVAQVSGNPAREVLRGRQVCREGSGFASAFSKRSQFQVRNRLLCLPEGVVIDSQLI